MLGFLRRGVDTDVTPAATPPAPAGVTSVPVAVALPDVLNAVRRRSLFHQVGLSLQGASGGVVGYDRGDPAHSVTGPVNAQQLPTAAFARLSFRDEQRILPTPQAYDLGTNDPQQNAYKLNQLARIARRK